MYRPEVSLAVRYRKARYVYKQIKDDPSPFMDPVKVEIAWYLDNMPREYMEEIWAIDSQKVHDVFVKRITVDNNRYIDEDFHLMIMDKLEEAAVGGATVDVHWRYDVEDDNMKELGEELGEDLEKASFHLEELDEDG